MNKVSIAGAGEVGASCATCFANRNFVNEIVIVNVKPGGLRVKHLTCGSQQPWNSLIPS